MLSAALSIAAQDAPGRRVVLSERSNFPTDLYIAQALCAERGCTLKLVDAPDIERALADGVAVLMLTHVNYRTGAMHDMAALTARGACRRRAGDLGPGAQRGRGAGRPARRAGRFRRRLRLQVPQWRPGRARRSPGCIRATRTASSSRWPGWWGHAAPFEFTPEYRPAPGIARYLCGTQPVLSMTGARVRTRHAGWPALPLGGMQALRRKSLALTDLFIALVEERCADAGFTLVTPREPARRGSQVCLSRDRGRLRASCRR